MKKLSFIMSAVVVFLSVSCSNITPSDTVIDSETSTLTPSTTVEDSSESISIPSESATEEVTLVSLGQLSNSYFEVLSSNQENNYSLQVELLYSDSTTQLIDVTSDMIDGDIDFYNVGNYRITINYENLSSRYDIYVYQDKSLTVTTSDSISGLNKYSTGSYASFTKNSISFDFYNCYKNSNYNLVKLLSAKEHDDINALGGSIYNTTAINQLSEITITYQTSGDNLTVNFGKTRASMETITLDRSDNEFTTKTIQTNLASFFEIETLSTDTDIKSFELTYLDLYTADKVSYVSSGENHYRINPVVYEGTLVSGESMVQVPISIERKGDYYTILETKTYTYYDLAAVTKDPSLASVAAMTTPMDVANYFIAFKTYPANYVYKKQFSSAKAVFGNAARCVSDYSRTNGYATTVPAKFVNGAPHYYECDIALDNTYSSSNRGVGRLVIWEYGFTCQGYDDSIVAVYTDDHYATFVEYYNNGLWSERFNAEMNATAYIHGAATTLLLTN